MTELMFSILFFILVSTICVQCFATAFSQSRAAKELTGAINVATNAAEVYLTTDEKTDFTQYYDGDWQLLDDGTKDSKYKATGIIVEPETKGECQSMHVVVSTMNDEEIYSLVVEKALH
jgi:hypothetical protein